LCGLVSATDERSEKKLFERFGRAAARELYRTLRQFAGLFNQRASGKTFAVPPESAYNQPLHQLS
jgi:hypothetical protein